MHAILPICVGWKFHSVAPRTLWNLASKNTANSQFHVAQNLLLPLPDPRLLFHIFLEIVRSDLPKITFVRNMSPKIPVHERTPWAWNEIIRFLSCYYPCPLFNCSPLPTNILSQDSLHNFGAFLIILSFAKSFASSSFYPFLPHPGQWPGHCFHLGIVFSAKLAAKASSILLATSPEKMPFLSPWGLSSLCWLLQAFDVSQLVAGQQQQQQSGHWPGNPSRHCMRLWARHGQPRP